MPVNLYFASIMPLVGTSSRRISYGSVRESLRRALSRLYFELRQKVKRGWAGGVVYLLSPKGRLNNTKHVYVQQALELHVSIAAKVATIIKTCIAPSLAATSHLEQSPVATGSFQGDQLS